MHVLLIVAHAGKDDNRDLRVNVANESGQSDSIDLGHFEIDDDDFTVVMSEPGGAFESVGNGLAGVTVLTQVSDEKLSDAGVIIDDQELKGRSLGKVHVVL